MRLEDGSTGATRDVSAGGVFFEIEGPVPAIGTPITFSIRMSHLDAQGPINVRFTAEVVRVEIAEGRVGIGARILAQSFASDA